MLLFNREDCCASYLSNFTIKIGDNENGEGNALCVANGGDMSSYYDIIKYCNPPLKGRYLHVQLQGQDRMLTLCELQVYSERIGKIYKSYHPGQQAKLPYNSYIACIPIHSFNCDLMVGKLL